MSSALGRAVLAVRAEHRSALRRAGEAGAGQGGGARRSRGRRRGGEDVAYLRGSTARLAMPVSSPHKVTHHHIIFSTLRLVQLFCGANTDFNDLVKLNDIFYFCLIYL